MAAKLHSIWMGDLDPYMDETFISSAFSTMGEPVVNVKTIRLKSGGLAGYCFVEAQTQDDAERIIQKLNGQLMPGTNPPKRFKLNWAMHGKEVPNYGTEYSVFVGDLSPDVTDLFLLTFFQLKYSSVKAAKIVCDSSGRSRGYGFVRFFDPEQHRLALTEMQGAVGCGTRAIRVSPAIAKQKTYTYSTQQTPTVATAAMYMQAYQYPQYATQYAMGYDPTAWYQQQQQQQQYTQMADATQTTQAQEQPTAGDEADDAPVDPNEPLDIAAANKALIDKDNALFYQLEASRWFPVENYSATFPLPELAS